MKPTHILSVFIACYAVFPAGAEDDTGMDVVSPFEVVPTEDEQQGVEAIRQIQHKLQLSRPSMRGQHPKAHGCVKAVFQARADIPADMRVGVLKDMRPYTAYIRYSNGREFDDRKPESSHGMAIKLLGVEGEKLMPEARDAKTQDFLLVDSPTFFSENPTSLAKFVKSMLEAVGAAVEAGEDAEQARIEFMRDNVKEFPEIERLLSRIKANMMTNPLSATYHSATPYLLAGENKKFMVRYKAVPRGQSKDSTPITTKDGLKEAMVRQLVEQKQPAAFEFRMVRYQSSPPEGAAEDPTQEWDKFDETTVADIVIFPQDFSTDEATQLCEQLSFTPWHSLPEHKPMGGINRARLPVYRDSVTTRRHDPVSEPEGWAWD